MTDPSYPPSGRAVCRRADRPAARTAWLLVLVAALQACGTTSPPPPKPVVKAQPAPGAPADKAPTPSQASPNATFVRPAAGATIARFNGNTNKGIDIAGSAGDPVLASANGRVVIVTGALRAMGTMVIVKHNETFITAYAHVDRALVKEGDTVRQGQKIALMGKTGTDRVKLHFEIRRQGNAVDPEPYLVGKLR